MPELRQNFATKEWVIIATERAKRPEEMATHRAPRNPVSFNPKCPFCPGNESITPPEVMRIPADGGAWNVRVVPNKFAALSRDAQPKRVIHRQRRSIEGFGVHDVIIETPDHAGVLALMPDAEVANILRCYKSRYNDLARTLRTVLAKLYHGLQDPDFNYTIRSAPSEWVGVKYFHWYLSVIPRLTRVAGFELGSGMFINTVTPESAADFLRNVKVEA